MEEWETLSIKWCQSQWKRCHQDRRAFPHQLDCGGWELKDQLLKVRTGLSRDNNVFFIRAAVPPQGESNMFDQAELGGLGGQRVRVPCKPHANTFSARKRLSRCNFLIQSHDLLRAPSGSVHGCTSGRSPAPSPACCPARSRTAREQRSAAGPAAPREVRVRGGKSRSVRELFLSSWSSV